MRNFGASLFDITSLEGALRISVGGIWVESTAIKNGRSVLAVEVAKDRVSVDVLFFKFRFEGKW